VRAAVQNPAPYADDLAYVHAVGFSGLAAGATPSIVERLRASASPVRRVYDVGCGSGVSTRIFAAAGYDVVALEPSEALAALARAAAPAAQLHVTSAYGYAFEPCDAIVAVGEPLTYHARQTDPARQLEEFFGQAARALRPGGHLVFDLIETGPASLDARGWLAGDDWAVLFAVAEDVAGRRLTRTIETFRQIDGTYRRSGEVHHVAIFESAWVLAALHAAGFAATTSTAYGAQSLGVRRRAFFAVRAGR
jgi:SAM-dependent methyltransferase